MTPPTEPTHYTILSLPSPIPSSATSLPPSDLKLAYHRALLRHHPDKKSPARTPTASPNGATNIHEQEQKKKEVLHADRNGSETSGGVAVYTIDQITQAYKTLSNPAARAEYDRQLRMKSMGRVMNGHGHATEGNNDNDTFRTGLEVFDLDDMVMSTDTTTTTTAVNGGGDGEGEEGGGTIWYRSCRCGDERGFQVREEELEREVERGEVVVGCRGCSLWARVVFAVDEDGDGEDGG